MQVKVFIFWRRIQQLRIVAAFKLFSIQIDIKHLAKIIQFSQIYLLMPFSAHKCEYAKLS